MSHHKEYFGFKVDPFTSELPTQKLLELPSMLEVREKVKYTTSIGGAMVVTGDVGSGKSTSLRWAVSHLHPSSSKVISITACSTSLTDLLKQMCWAIDLEIKGASRSFLIRSFKNAILEISAKKINVVLVIDEANLLRSEVLAELHTLTQFEFDSVKHLTLILAGQSILIDRLTLRTSAPLASRVIAKTHVPPVSTEQMQEYISHHLNVAGVKKRLFTDQAITAIQQGSGGILRKANALAKGSVVAAAIEKTNTIEAEHVRIAATELII